MSGRVVGRMPAVAGAAAAVALMLAGCGQVPATVRLDGAAESRELPAECLAAGLDVALGLGTYALPLAGASASVDELPSWESATLQLPSSSRIASGDGAFTLCSYVADHPTPFSTRGGDDTIVCVLVDPDGTATLLGTRMASAGDATACTPTGG